MSKILASLLALFLLAGVCLNAADKKPVTDDAIYDNVINKLASDPIVKGGALKVDVKDGVVTLAGPVANERQKEKATTVARKVKGVKSVINNLTIQDRPAAK
jgi:osmotically-inducible protein OsmY